MIEQESEQNEYEPTQIELKDPQPTWKAILQTALELLTFGTKQEVPVALEHRKRTQIKFQNDNNIRIIFDCESGKITNLYVGGRHYLKEGRRVDRAVSDLIRCLKILQADLRNLNEQYRLVTKRA